MGRWIATCLAGATIGLAGCGHLPVARAENVAMAEWDACYACPTPDEADEVTDQESARFDGWYPYAP
jgi:hypothetical protein